MSRRQQGKSVQKGGAHVAAPTNLPAESGNLESKEGLKPMEQEGASKGILPLQQEKGTLGTEKGQEKSLLGTEKGKEMKEGSPLLGKGQELEKGKELEKGTQLEKGKELEKGKGLEKGKALEKGKGKGHEKNVIGIDVPKQEIGGMPGGVTTTTGTSGGVPQGLNLGKRPAEEILIDPREAGPKPPFPEQTQEHTAASHKMSPVPDYGEQSYKGFGRLKDRIALVTGGDSGIGRAVCLAFAREGAHVICSYLQNHKDAEETKALIESCGRQALLLPGDIGDDSHCQKLIKQIVDKFGRLDILVNNAAFQRKAVESMEQLDAETVEKTFKTNIISMFSLVRLALPHMKPGSSIINVSSIQGYSPSPQILDYATTKGAIVAFTKGLAEELLTKYGIRVNCVAPGPVWTPLIVQSFPPEKVKEFGKSCPMGRPAQPAELAPPFVFLASDESRFVVGEILAVTGGKITA